MHYDAFIWDLYFTLVPATSLLHQLLLPLSGASPNHATPRSFPRTRRQPKLKDPSWFARSLPSVMRARRLKQKISKMGAIRPV